MPRSGSHPDFAISPKTRSKQKGNVLGSCQGADGSDGNSEGVSGRIEPGQFVPSDMACPGLCINLLKSRGVGRRV